MPEAEYQARRIAEVVLVGVRERIGKPGQEVINLRWPERDRVTQRDVDATTECHRKSILRWRSLSSAGSSHRLAYHMVRISIHITVRRSEQEVRKWVQPVGSNLDLRSEQVCEQVT